jgi:hypothetical protein
MHVSSCGMQSGITVEVGLVVLGGPDDDRMSRVLSEDGGHISSDDYRVSRGELEDVRHIDVEKGYTSLTEYVILAMKVD